MEYKKEFENKPGRRITTSSPRDVRRRQQRKDTDAVLIEGLREQLEGLKDQFTVGTGGITPEKVDAEIRSAVKGAVKETKGYYEKLLKEANEREKGLYDRIRDMKNTHSREIKDQKESSDEHLNTHIKNLEERYNKTVSSLEDRLKLAEDKIALKDVEREDMVKEMFEQHTRKLEELARAMSVEKLGVDDPDRPKMEEVFVDPIEAGAGDALESHIKVEDISLTEKKKIGGKVDKLKSLMKSFPEK